MDPIDSACFTDIANTAFLYMLPVSTPIGERSLIMATQEGWNQGGGQNFEYKQFDGAVGKI